MNLLADEGVDRQIVERLRQDGHDVLYIAEMAPGISDDEILSRANALDTLLFTADKDFGELVYRQNLVHAGVLLIRLAGVPPEAKQGSFRRRCANAAQKWLTRSVLSHLVRYASAKDNPKR